MPDKSDKVEFVKIIIYIYIPDYDWQVFMRCTFHLTALCPEMYFMDTQYQ